MSEQRTLLDSFIRTRTKSLAEDYMSAYYSFFNPSEHHMGIECLILENNTITSDLDELIYTILSNCIYNPIENRIYVRIMTNEHLYIVELSEEMKQVLFPTTVVNFGVNQANTLNVFAISRLADPGDYNRMSVVDDATFPASLLSLFEFLEPYFVHANCNEIVDMMGIERSRYEIISLHELRDRNDVTEEINNIFDTMMTYCRCKGDDELSPGPAPEPVQPTPTQDAVQK